MPVLYDHMFTHLKKLSTVQSNKGIHFLTPAASPSSHCPMNAASRLAGSIQGLSSLVIGTQECAYYSRLVLREPYGKDGALHWMYVLDANEVVFGCREGLLQALTQMDEAGAKAILLIVTCVPDLIGEDMEAIVYELQPEIAARLVPISVPHFGVNGHPSGIWKTLESIASIMQRRKTIPRSVNLLGLHTSAPSLALPLPSPLLRTLSATDVTLRALGPDSTIDEFISAPDATLNIVLSPYMAPLAKRMAKDFGIPFVYLHDVYGIQDIDMAYAAIGEHLSLDWGDAFTDGRSTLLAIQESVDSQLRELSFIATDGAIDPIPLSSYLTTLGMKPLLLHVEEFYQEDRQWALALHAQGHDPWVCHMVNDVAENPIFEALRPAFCLGNVPLPLRGKVPHVDHLHDMNGTFGYERTVWLLAKMMQAVSSLTPDHLEGVV